MKIQTLALAITLAGTTAGHASVVNGFNDVTDLGGGIFKFVFDTVPSDIDGTGMGLGFTGGGITITATSAEGIVRQDHPANGGLGVLGSSGSDNLETGLGETLLLSFSRSIEIVNFTLNGLLGGNGHSDAADGLISTNSNGTVRGDGPADAFDGLGFDFVPDSFESICEFGPEYCATTSILFSNASVTPFKGYLESVTIRVSPVPLPASFAMLALGLGGVGAVARKRRKAA